MHGERAIIDASTSYSRRNAFPNTISRIIKHVPDAKILYSVRHPLATRFGPLDVLAFIEEGREYDDLLHDTIEIKFRGQKVRMLSLKTLVALKQRSRDPKDRQRLPILQETLRQSNAKNK